MFWSDDRCSIRYYVYGISGKECGCGSNFHALHTLFIYLYPRVHIPPQLNIPRSDPCHSVSYTCYKRSGFAHTCTQFYLRICEVMKWLVAERPYLIEQTAVAPHITGSGVLAIVKGLWSRPFDRNLSTVRYVIVFVL